MGWKARFVIFSTAAILVGLAVLRITPHPEKRPNQVAVQPHRDLGGGKIPPFYTNLEGIRVPTTLAPGGFTVPKTRHSYEVARAIPQDLMQLPCYCWCDRIDHNSLLDCFVDAHAEFCGICQDSALWAERRLKEQASIETIRQELIDAYSAEYGQR